MDRTYKDNKTLNLDKAHGFCTVVPPKKIENLLSSTINKFINNAIISNDIFLVLD